MDLTPGEKVRLLRERKGITQEALGMNVGVSQMHISRIERGFEPDASLKALIEGFFGAVIWSEKGAKV